MKKMLLLLFGVSALLIKAQFSSANELVEFSKKNFSEKKSSLVKNGWKKLYTEPDARFVEETYEKTINGVSNQTIVGKGSLSSGKSLNITSVFLPESKMLRKILNELSAKYSFSRIADVQNYENNTIEALSYAERNFSIMISLLKYDDGEVVHRIKIAIVK